MKKILVFGGSGGTGKHFIEQALNAGYAITAIVRNPHAFAIVHQNLKVIKGDVLIPHTYEKEFDGHEAVVWVSLKSSKRPCILLVSGIL